MLDALPEPDRAVVVHALDRHYVASALPRSLLDGVLLYLSLSTRRRYPLYLHGAQLLSGGAPPEALAGWLEFGGWEDPGALIRQWEQTHAVEALAPPGHGSSGSSDSSAHAAIAAGSAGAGLSQAHVLLVARTVTLLAHSPTLGAEVVGALRTKLGPELSAGALGLAELWACLGTRYRWHPEVDLAREPRVVSWRSSLDPLVDAHAYVATPRVAPQPGSPDTAESVLVSVDLAATLLEALPLGVLRLDSKGRIGYENPAIREILGVPTNRPSVAVGMRIVDLPNMRPWITELTALIDSGEAFDVRRAPFVSVFGKMGIVNATGRAIRDGRGERIGSLILVADARREVELERQVVALGQREMFGGLVSRIGHDLNNLLVGVRGNAALLAQRLPAADPNHLAARRVDEASQRLASLVDGLLELAHPSDGEVEAWCDVTAVVRDTVGMVRGLLSERVALALVLPPEPLYGVVHPAALRQVLLNLCVNARDGIMLWPDGRRGRISLVVETARAAEPGETPHHRLTLADDGVGLSEAQLATLFDPLESTRTGGPGLGLGMPVSRALIAAHGGTVNCVAGANGGLTVVLTLRAAAARCVPGEQAPPAPTGARVLVVEDNDVVRDLCVDVLESRGFTVVCVGSGRAALVALRGGVADVALLDVGLPDVSGLEVLAEATRLGITTPVILTSGNSREALGTAGPPVNTTFLRKPFLVPELINAVERALRR